MHIASRRRRALTGVAALVATHAFAQSSAAPPDTHGDTVLPTLNVYGSAERSLTSRSTAEQKRTLEQAYVLPFGALTKVQAVRANVKGFTPFRIPRMSDVWFEQ